MRYVVLRPLTANGRAYQPGDRIEGAELTHEATLAARRQIKLVSEAEAAAPNPTPGDVHVPKPAPSPQYERGRGRS